MEYPYDDFTMATEAEKIMTNDVKKKAVQDPKDGEYTSKVEKVESNEGRSCIV